jgi:hypothetical protein
MDAETLALIRAALATARRLLDDPDPSRRADAASEATHWAVLTWGQHRGRPSLERLLVVLGAVFGAMEQIEAALREDGRERGLSVNGRGAQSESPGGPESLSAGAHGEWRDEHHE